MARSSFTIAVTSPFRLDFTVWALRRRPLNQVDRWDGSVYRRTLSAGNVLAEVEVTQVGSIDAPRLHVDVRGTASAVSQRCIRQMLDRVLGLDIDLSPFYRFAAQEPRLNDIATRFRGMRPPRFPTIFEALVNGIACQQFSLEVGLTLLNRLAAAYGHLASHMPEAVRSFPRPHDLANATLASLHALGFSHNKGVAISELASALERGELCLDELGGLDDGALLARLDQLRGVGRWTAEYVLLRGYGRLDVFPGDDIGARHGLQQWLRLRRPLDYKRTQAILRRWQPYSGLVYLHLLLKSLAEKGLLMGA